MDYQRNCMACTRIGTPDCPRGIDLNQEMADDPLSGIEVAKTCGDQGFRLRNDMRIAWDAASLVRK